MKRTIALGMSVALAMGGVGLCVQPQDAEALVKPLINQKATATIQFKDSILKERIIDVMKKQKTIAPDATEITEEDALKIHGFLELGSVDSNKITSLGGIEKFKNLTGLWLSDNNISDITPLASLTNLLFLKLDGNHIFYVTPLAGLTNLANLDLRNNQISNILPLKDLTDLTALWLANNKISNITPLVGLPKLNTLDATDQIINLQPTTTKVDLTKEVKGGFGNIKFGSDKNIENGVLTYKDGMKNPYTVQAFCSRNYKKAYSATINIDFSKAKEKPTKEYEKTSFNSETSSGSLSDLLASHGAKIETTPGLVAVGSISFNLHVIGIKPDSTANISVEVHGKLSKLVLKANKNGEAEQTFSYENDDPKAILDLVSISPTIKSFEGFLLKEKSTPQKENTDEYEHINTFNHEGDIKQLPGHVAGIEIDGADATNKCGKFSFTPNTENTFATVKLTGLKPDSYVCGTLGYGSINLKTGYALDGPIHFEGSANSKGELTVDAVTRIDSVPGGVPGLDPGAGFNLRGDGKEDLVPVVGRDRSTDEKVSSNFCNVHINNIDCWIKKDSTTNDKQPESVTDIYLTANCDVIKKANGKYRLIYTLPSDNSPYKLLPDTPADSPDWFHMPNGEGTPSAAKHTYSDNVKFVQGDNSGHLSLFNGLTGKPINAQSTRVVAILQNNWKDILANEITTKNVLPRKVIFDDVDVKDTEINKLVFTYAIGTDGYVATPHTPTIIRHFYNEGTGQTDDISSELETLLNEYNDIKKTDNYKNADDNLKQAYDKAITDGKAVYDKLSSTPEQVKQAAEQIKTTLEALNGDKKAQAIKEQLSTATQKIASLQGDLEKAKQQNTTDKSKIDELTGKISALNGQLEQLKQDNTKSVEEKQKEITKLNSQIEDLNKQVTQLTKDKENLQQQLNKATENLSNVTAQLEQAKKDKQKADETNQQTIATLNGQIAQLNKDKQDLQGQIDNKTQQITALNKQIEQVEQDKTKGEQEKQKEIEKLNGQIAQLNKDKQELQGKLGTATGNVQKLTAELEKAKQQGTADASTIANLNKQVSELQGKLEKLKSDKTLSDEQKQAEIDKLNRQIENLGKQVAQLTNDKKALSEQLQQAQSNLADVQKKLQTATEQGVADKSKIEKLNGQISTLNDQLEKLKGDKTLSDQQKQAEIDKLNGKITDLGKQIEQLTKEKQSLQQQLDAATDNIKKLTGELDKAKEQGIADKSTIQSLNEQLQQAKNTLEQLKSDKTKSDEQKQKEIDQLNAKITELGKQIAHLTKDKENLTQQLQTIQQSLADVQKKLQKAQEQGTLDTNNIATLNQQVKTLNEQLNQLKQDKTKSDKEKQAEIDKLNGQIEELNKQIKDLSTHTRPENGSIVLPNGNVVNPDGTVVLLDGNKIKPDGTITDSQGKPVDTAHATVDKDGNKVLPNGIKIKPNGDKELPDGIIVKNNGNVILPDGKVVYFAGGAIVAPLINDKPEFDLEKYKKEHPEEFNNSTPDNNSSNSGSSTGGGLSVTVINGNSGSGSTNVTDKKETPKENTEKEKKEPVKQTTTTNTGAKGTISFVTKAKDLIAAIEKEVDEKLDKKDVSAVKATAIKTKLAELKQRLSSSTEDEAKPLVNELKQIKTDLDKQRDSQKIEKTDNLHDKRVLDKDKQGEGKFPKTSDNAPVGAVGVMVGMLGILFGSKYKKAKHAKK